MSLELGQRYEFETKLKNAEISDCFVDAVDSEFIYLDNELDHVLDKGQLRFGLAICIRSLQKDLEIK